MQSGVGVNLACRSNIPIARQSSLVVYSREFDKISVRFERARSRTDGVGPQDRPVTPDLGCEDSATSPKPLLPVVSVETPWQALKGFGCDDGSDPTVHMALNGEERAVG